MSVNLPMLGEAASMELPPGATVNQDGSVTLLLDYPFELEFRVQGSDTVQTEHFGQLVLRRLDGPAVRKMLASPNAAKHALALSLGISLAKLALIKTKIDARDETAAGDVVQELLGGLKGGLPEGVEETPGGIKLPLRYPVTDAEGATVSEISFARITAAQKAVILRSQSPVDWGIAAAIGISPKAAKALVDQMDGADAIAANMVILFLCGSALGASR
nr:hypothetical protein [uncultured Rhodopila sp.]